MTVVQTILRDVLRLQLRPGVCALNISNYRTPPLRVSCRRKDIFVHFVSFSVEILSLLGRRFVTLVRKIKCLFRTLSSFDDDNSSDCYRVMFRFVNVGLAILRKVQNFKVISKNYWRKERVTFYWIKKVGKSGIDWQINKQNIYYPSWNIFGCSMLRLIFN